MSDCNNIDTTSWIIRRGYEVHTGYYYVTPKLYTSEVIAKKYADKMNHRIQRYLNQHAGYDQVNHCIRPDAEERVRSYYSNNMWYTDRPDYLENVVTSQLQTLKNYIEIEPWEVVPVKISVQ